MVLVQGLHTGDAGVDGLAPGLELRSQLLDLQLHLGPGKDRRAEKHTT